MRKHENTSAGKHRFLQWIATAFVLYGGYQLIRFLWVKLLIWILQIQSAVSASEAASIGIIGGADGPTAIFVTAPDLPSYWIPGLLFLAGIGLLMIIRKKKNK